jgi:hypothetical protein
VVAGLRRPTVRSDQAVRGLAKSLAGWTQKHSLLIRQSGGPQDLADRPHDYATAILRQGGYSD